MKNLFAGFLFALAFLFSADAAQAVNCNNPSGFAKFLGPITAGDLVVIGQNCETLLDGGAFSTSSLPKAYIAGYNPSNDGSVPTTAIDLSSGSCRDSLNVIDIVGGAFIKSISSTWALGSGTAIGGLDSGAVAANTSYFIFRIIRGDTLVTDALISTSPSAPTLPTNYTAFCRVGAFKTLPAAATICQFRQSGAEFLYLLDDCGGAAFQPGGVIGIAQSLVTTYVPQGIQVDALLRVQMQSPGAANTFLSISSPDQTDPPTVANSFSLATANTATSISAGEFITRTDTSGRIRLKSSVAATPVYGTTRGFIDLTRGQ